MGDPLFTVSLYTSDPDYKKLRLPTPAIPLCYEVHGAIQHDKFYNLITSECVSVNAHFIATGDSRNVIDQVGIQATDSGVIATQTFKIKVLLGSCSASVDGFLNPTSLNAEPGFILKQESKAVVVTVPNCVGEKSLEMRIDCQEVPRKQLSFKVTRGLNFGHIDTHGLLGKVINSLT